MPSSPYHVYLDLDVINNDYSSNSPPQLRLEENGNARFLDGDNKDYICSIARFSIQTAKYQDGNQRNNTFCNRKYNV